MKRSEAISLVVDVELATLNESERESLLLDWWSLDSDDDEYGALPEALREELSCRDAPVDASDQRYDVLLRVALAQRFVGVRNAYLASRLEALGHRVEAVVGEVEVLQACPCCGYRCLQERGAYEICHVCFWEDDGSDELDVHSGPNHKTLREGRETFERLGAVSEAMLANVLVDGMSRYERE